jgi:hypothetical protein
VEFERTIRNDMAREHRPDAERQSIGMEEARGGRQPIGQSLMRETGMTLIWLGVLFVFGGVLQMAYQPIWRGRLSGRRRLRSGRPSDTLEPERPASGFGIKSNWPGLAMVALGAAFLLAAAAI